MEGSEGAAVRLLGELSVRIGNERVTDAIGGPVGQLAFSYLVLNRDHAVRRDQLAAAIWEERAPANPDAALRVVLSRLRTALGSRAVEGRAELRLVLPEPADVDVERLRELVLAAEAGVELEPACAAVELASQELLPGLEADWIAQQREAFSELRIRALTALGVTALHAGGEQLATAEHAARRLIALAPFRESGHRLLIEALAARGEQAEALRAYEQLRQLLREELGTTPGPELAELHTRLLQEFARTDRPTGALVEQLPLPGEASPGGRPALAGRAAELARLTELARTCRSGASACVMIGGDPGIGKSRLSAELARGAHDAGDNVLWGRCHEEALVPYEPFVEGLRQYAAALSEKALAELVHAAGSAFLRLAPDLARRLPPGALTPVADDPQAQRYQLFESVAELLTLAACERPLLVVLEDLHWADRGTMLLLAHILRRAGDVPALIVGTYRVTEVAAGPPLPDRAELLELSGLAPEETAQIVAELAPDAGLAPRIHEETEGNPLFIVELLRALEEDGETAAVPRRIGEVIDRRLRGLGSDASTLLGVGAVLGRSFTFDDVARISGLDQARLLDAVEEAIAARVIEEERGRPGGLSFTHALLREVRYSQHSSARRIALHDAAAEAIRALHGDELDERIADVAGHLAAAARDRRSARVALEALRQAGVQAAERQAFEDAAGWFERARGVFEPAQPSAAGRCDVLLGLADSLRASDRIEEARAAARAAAVYARELGDGDRLARAALAFVGSHLVFKAGRPDQEDIGLLEEAIELLPPAPGEALRVRLLARLSTAIYYGDRFDEVPQLASVAMKVARAAGGHDDALGWAHYMRFWAELRPDGVARAADAMKHLSAIARRTGSIELASECHMVEWYALLREGRPDLVAQSIERNRERIVTTGIPIYRWFADAISAMLAVTAGRHEEAELMIKEVASTGAAIDPHDLPRFAAMTLLQLRHHQGRLGELVEPLRTVVANNPGLSVWRGVLLQALAAEGHSDEAAALLTELARDDFRWLRRDVNWLWAMSCVGSACARLGDERAAAVIYRLLSAIPEQSVVSGPALGFYGPVDRYLGPLAGLLGRHQDADAHFTRAIKALEEVGAVPLAAATRTEQARLLAAR